MTQIDLINAYEQLEDLSKLKDFHAKEQWALYGLRKELRSYVDFYQERMKAIVEKYKPFADEQGIIKGQEYLDFIHEQEDLNKMEVEHINAIELPIVDGITFLTMESLEGFVNFKEP